MKRGHIKTINTSGFFVKKYTEQEYMTTALLYNNVYSCSRVIYLKQQDTAREFLKSIEMLH